MMWIVKGVSLGALLLGLALCSVDRRADRELDIVGLVLACGGSAMLIAALGWLGD